MEFVRRVGTSAFPHYGVIAFVVGVLFVDQFIQSSEGLLWLGVVIGGLPVFFRAATEILHFRITIDLFNVFALSVALALGEIHSGAFIVLMLAVAALLDHYTESGTTNAVEELLRLKPRTAFRESPHGSVDEIPVAKVRPGDTLIIHSGARVSVDGVIVWGRATLDESSLTGESRSIVRHVGDDVYSGTINVADPVKIRATKVGADSTIERMAALIAVAARSRSRTEKLADTFAQLFLPLVIILAGLTYMYGGPLMAVALLLVACADDIAVALPLAVHASIGVAAKRGIIVKGGEWFAALDRIDTIVLDKTGTLTYGVFCVQAHKIADRVDPARFWEFVAAAEKLSEHPIGRAIAAEALRRSPRAGEPHSLSVLPGAGISAVYKHGTVHIGNTKLAEGEGFTIPPDASALERTLGTEGVGTVVFVFINKEYAGLIGVADKPRTEAQNALRAIRSLGITRIIMLTGDGESAAKDVADALGITEWTSGVTPEAKLDLLDQLADKGRHVAMVGDGINDAPALARADVGIAMGGIGTAVAVEAANVIILSDDLSRIPEVIRIARRTMSVARADMWIWFVTNMGGFALVWMGIFGPVLAAAYNLATDFLPILNSFRLFLMRPSTAPKVSPVPRKPKANQNV